MALATKILPKEVHLTALAVMSSAASIGSAIFPFFAGSECTFSGTPIDTGETLSNPVLWPFSSGKCKRRGLPPTFYVWDSGRDGHAMVLLPESSWYGSMRAVGDRRLDLTTI